jgi:hypothetical protein
MAATVTEVPQDGGQGVVGIASRLTAGAATAAEGNVNLPELPPLTTDVEVLATLTCDPWPATEPRCVHYDIQDSKFHRDIPKKPFPDRFALQLLFSEAKAGGTVTVVVTGANRNKPVTAEVDAQGGATLNFGMKRKAKLTISSATVTDPTGTSTDITDLVAAQVNSDGQPVALQPGVDEATFGNPCF